MSYPKKRISSACPSIYLDINGRRRIGGFNECKELYDKEIKKRIKEIEKYFRNLRFNDNHRLGSGDIRLTPEQQEEIINKLKGE